MARYRSLAAIGLLLVATACGTSAAQAQLPPAAGPCNADDPTSVQQWTTSAGLVEGEYEAIDCAELDEVEGPEMILGETDTDGALSGWLVLRSDPDKVRVPFTRRPAGLRTVRFDPSATTVIETIQGSGGSSQVTSFGFEDGRYIVFSREARGPIRPGWTIRHRRGGPPRAGRFDMDDATLARARRVFGRPQRYLRRKTDWCTARFRRGATIQAFTLGLAPRRRCAGSLSVTEVRLSAAGWHTTRGLRIGDSSDRIDDAYPGAYGEEDYLGNVDERRQVLHDANVGLGRFGTVVAITDGGRVVAFELNWPNAGE